MSASLGKILFCLVLFASMPVCALEVYHWVDENGVANFSQNKPSGELSGVRVLELEDNSVPDYDPEEDRYGVQAQAERMVAMREEMEQRRAQARQRNQYPVQQSVVQYSDPYRNYSRGLWLPPAYPVRPPKPEPPIEVPYPVSTLDPSVFSSR